MVSSLIISNVLCRAILYLYQTSSDARRTFRSIPLPIRRFWESLDDPETVSYVLSLQLQQKAWFAPFR